SPDTPTASPSPIPSRTGVAGAVGSVGSVGVSWTAGGPAWSAMDATLGAGPQHLLVRSCRCPLPLVGARRHADGPLEVPGQVRLVGEPGVRRDLGGRQPGVQQLPGQPDPDLVEVGV